MGDFAKYTAIGNRYYLLNRSLRKVDAIYKIINQSITAKSDYDMKVLYHSVTRLNFIFYRLISL